MVPSWLVALSSMRGTILMAVGRHRSVRYSEAASVHMGFGAHVLVLCLAGYVLTVDHVPCVDHAGRLACIGTLNQVPRLGHADRLCMCQLSHACHAAGGPPESAGGRQGPLWKIFVGAAI